MSGFSNRASLSNLLVLGVIAVAAAIGVGFLLFGVPWGPAKAGAQEYETQKRSATLIFAKAAAPGEPEVAGLRLTWEAYDGLQISPKAAARPAQTRALPAQTGTFNYDIERLFQLPGRVAGEIAELAEVEEPGISDKPVKRPLRYGDKVKQGQLLAVVYSPTLGQQKAALVDASNSLRLSEEQIERHRKLYAEGALSYAQLKASERQVEADKNAVLTAERTLRLWKMDDQEIRALKEEAEDIRNRGQERNAEAEAKKWGRVEIRVPVFDPDHMDRELTIVEKNTNLHAMIDPINTATPLFKVADMNRLQIWAHPPEEYLPLIRKMLDNGGGPARWDVVVQGESEQPPMALTFYQVCPSLDPIQHTPMVVGHIDNPGGNKYVVGQFVTVTLHVRAPADTVEVPTEALNEINGESLVFVQPDPAKYEFFQRRVSVVARFKDISFARSKLTAKDKQYSQQEVVRGRRPLAEIQVGDRLVTRGILEMTACLEGLLVTQKKD
jgi:cobalt-zinc-cadmium efflux system membrane fusion protein